MSGYPSRAAPVEPGPCDCGECHPCVYPGCIEPSRHVYGKRLCLAHGVKANRKLEAEGVVGWEERCVAVGKWLDAKQGGKHERLEGRAATDG